MAPTDRLARLTAAKRPNYVAGKLLTADDFQTEQAYHIGQRRLLNRFLHGAGAAAGLEVTVSGSRVSVSPGVALDCLGREIVVTALTGLTLPAKGTRLYLCAAYAERGLNPLPLPPDPSPFDTPATFALTEETFTVALCPTPERHIRQGSAWQACGDDHGVPVARLLRTRGRWHVDPTYRQPTVA